MYCLALKSVLLALWNFAFLHENRIMPLIGSRCTEVFFDFNGSAILSRASPFTCNVQQNTPVLDHTGPDYHKLKNTMFLIDWQQCCAAKSSALFFFLL